MSTTGVDPLLTPFLETPDEAESQGELVKLLMRHAQPISQSILRNKLRGDRRAEEGDDLYAEVRLKLLRQLRELRERRSAGAIRDFHRYVAVVTYHTWDEYLRRKHPQRARLKNRLRYLLTHRTGLALWQNERNEWLCGFAAWRKKSPARAEARGAGALDSLVSSVLEKVGRPLELDRLVAMMVESMGIREKPSVEVEDAAARGVTEPWISEVEERLYLRGLWGEICRLPVRQRAAVLLNLKDPEGRSAIELIHLLGIASIRGIAEALEMSAIDFARMWNHLPLEDARIAELLGVTRQQVINLRKAARERLRRRDRRVET